MLSPDALPSTPWPRRATWPRGLFLVVTLFLGAVLWDFGGLDVPLARWSGTAAGFALRDNWFLERVMHQGALAVSWLLLALLAIGIFHPVGVLRRIDRRARWQLVVAAGLSLIAISSLKFTSHTSCPWEVLDFGGRVPHVSHWLFGTSDGGGGRCFPGGHAAAGFVFVGGWFVFRGEAPAVARRWLAGAVLAGLVLGVSQQIRGAHFMSHTLWTGWICWAVAWACDAVAGRRRAPV